MAPLKLWLDYRHQWRFKDKFLQTDSFQHVLTRTAAVVADELKLAGAGFAALNRCAAKLPKKLFPSAGETDLAFRLPSGPQNVEVLSMVAQSPWLLRAGCRVHLLSSSLI